MCKVFNKSCNECSNLTLISPHEFTIMTNQKAVAEKLLQVGAVKLSPNEPFTWASGWKSPIYCDNRKVLSFPYVRDFIKSEMCNVIFEKFDGADMLAGVATAGIPWGAMAADQLKLPYIYVRPKPKEHGLGNQIEGAYTSSNKILVIEDLISTGKSSLQVVDVLRNAGLEVLGWYPFLIMDLILLMMLLKKQACHLFH